MSPDGYIEPLAVLERWPWPYASTAVVPREQPVGQPNDAHEDEDDAHDGMTCKGQPQAVDTAADEGCSYQEHDEQVFHDLPTFLVSTPTTWTYPLHTRVSRPDRATFVTVLT